MDERGLVTCPGDEKRHRGHDVAGVAQSVCTAWDRRGEEGHKGRTRGDEDIRHKRNTVETYTAF